MLSQTGLLNVLFNSSVQADKDRENFKMESTFTQQRKLIDFLQEKVETVPKKRKVSLYFVFFVVGH